MSLSRSPICFIVLQINILIVLIKKSVKNIKEIKKAFAKIIQNYRIYKSVALKDFLKDLSINYSSDSSSLSK